MNITLKETIFGKNRYLQPTAHNNLLRKTIITKEHFFPFIFSCEKVSRLQRDVTKVSFLVITAYLIHRKNLRRKPRGSISKKEAKIIIIFHFNATLVPM